MFYSVCFLQGVLKVQPDVPWVDVIDRHEKEDNLVVSHRIPGLIC